MESPHEHQQTMLLARIIGNVEKLNEAISSVNDMLLEINTKNIKTEMVAQMWKQYQSNVAINLEATNSLGEPK